MADLLIGLAFIAMILTPAVIASLYRYKTPRGDA